MTNEERNQLIQEVYHQPSEAISLIGVEELMAVIKSMRQSKMIKV